MFHRTRMATSRQSPQSYRKTTIGTWESPSNYVSAPLTLLILAVTAQFFLTFALYVPHQIKIKIEVVCKQRLSQRSQWQTDGDCRDVVWWGRCPAFGGVQTETAATRMLRILPDRALLLRARDVAVRIGKQYLFINSRSPHVFECESTIEILLSFPCFFIYPGIWSIVIHSLFVSSLV